MNGDHGGTGRGREKTEPRLDGGGQPGQFVVGGPGETLPVRTHV